MKNKWIRSLGSLICAFWGKQNVKERKEERKEDKKKKKRKGMETLSMEVFVWI